MTRFEVECWRLGRLCWKTGDWRWAWLAEAAMIVHWWLHHRTARPERAEEEP